MKKNLACCLFIFVLALGYSQQALYGWITSPEGLRVRSSAELSGTITGVIPFGEKVSIVSFGSKYEEIDAKLAKWIEIKKGSVQGWVYGGYISILDPKLFKEKNKLRISVQNISQNSKLWLPEDRGRFHVFAPDGSYRTGQYESGLGGSGTYTLKGGKIHVSYTISDDSGMVSEKESDTFQIDSIYPNKLVINHNGNNITLSTTFPDFVRHRDEHQALHTTEDWIMVLNTMRNMYYSNDNTLLIEAAQAEQSEIVWLLLNSGLDMNHTNSKGKTVFDVASFYTDDTWTEIKDYLWRNKK
ncbi:MAG: SH3 domain-containing protein [Spirochaetales bacterium]|nr:SH3 domain-containing protein [Spirochaetales bacterium]